MKQSTVICLILMLIGGSFLAYRAATGRMSKVYVRDVAGNISAVTPKESVTASVSVSPSRTLGLWISAFLTLSIFSFLYRDNPFYRFAESLFIGISAAYWMVQAFWTVLVPNLLGKLLPAMTARWATPGAVSNPNFYYLIPLALGIMLLWRLSPKGAWVARWPLAFIIGTTAGFRLIAYLEADFVNQIRNTILPLLVLNYNPQGTLQYTASLWSSVRNLLIVTGVLSGLVHFFFSMQHKGIAGRVSRVGIWFLMITFGAAFAYTVMGRIALLARRIEFLFDDWLWFIDPAFRRIGLW